MREVAKGLLGIGNRDPITRKINNILPHPLQPGEQPIELEPGVFRSHPVWSAGVQNETNAAYIQKVVEIVH